MSGSWNLRMLLGVMSRCRRGVFWEFDGVFLSCVLRDCIVLVAIGISKSVSHMLKY